MTQAGISGSLTLGGDLTTYGQATIVGGLSLGGVVEVLGNLILNNPGSDMGHAVRADRTITAGTGLVGGGNLTSNRTISLDTTYLSNNYLNKGSEPYLTVDMNGNELYARLALKNSPASDNSWLRVSSNSHGILPYTSGNSYLGTASWKFKEVHAVNFYENGTALSSKYSAATHNHDTRYSLATHTHDNYISTGGGTVAGVISFTTTTGGVEFERARTNVSKIFWNASTVADYGLRFDVDGANSLILYNPTANMPNLMTGELKIKHPNYNYNTTFGWGRTHFNNFNIVNDSGTVSVNNREVYTKGLEIRWGTAAPSGGTSGDVYIQYT